MPGQTEYYPWSASQSSWKPNNMYDSFSQLFVVEKLEVWKQHPQPRECTVRVCQWRQWWAFFGFRSFLSGESASARMQCKPVYENIQVFPEPKIEPIGVNILSLWGLFVVARGVVPWRSWERLRCKARQKKRWEQTILFEVCWSAHVNSNNAANSEVAAARG